MSYKISFLVFLSVFLISCSNSNQINIDDTHKKVKKQSPIYLPERIYLQRYPIISGSKHSIIVKDINIGVPLRFHAPIVVADYKITPTKEAFIKFRNVLDNLNVWNWKKKYYLNRSEGWTNKVILKYPDKEIDVEIVNKNPESFTKFMDALLELVQYKQNSLSKKEFMKKLKTLKSK